MRDACEWRESVRDDREEVSGVEVLMDAFVVFPL